ncbi:hypothetical protein [Legionella fairfieldensis]|uniref:hypothetical protein n=1 Tax=Legionella fairfieldensis TaxID=45064 RepID=UPI00048F09DD|nr:hypothetical protein [Legionella fairfieldensis]
MINESRPEFKKKISSCLKKCAPTPHGINLEQLVDLFPLTLRELAWLIAICENGYSYPNIPWEFPVLKGRVDGLESVFIEQINLDTKEYSESVEMASLVHKASMDAIHNFMDIQQEICLDNEKQEIFIYKICSLVNTRLLNITLSRLISSINAKQPRESDDPLQMMPWIKERNKEIRTDKIISLLNQICVENPIEIKAEKIIAPVQSYELAWVIVICNKQFNHFEDVTPPELKELTSLAKQTHKKIIDHLREINHLDKLKAKWFDEVDFRDSKHVTQQIFYEIPPNIILDIISNKSIYKVKSKFAAEMLIDSILKQDFGLLIRETFPDYTGKIHKKTSAPHRLIIKVMIMLLKLKRQDITWSTVKEFIEEHISRNHNRATLANLEDINEDNFTVSGCILTKINATKKVGDYKKAFKI